MFIIFAMTLFVFSVCTAQEKTLVNFTSNPRIVKPSMTDNLTMKCSLGTNLTDDVDYVQSIKVQRHHNTIASIERNGSAEVSDNADGHVVATGNIDGDGSNMYLNLVWKNPSWEESGEFWCIIEAIDTNNKPQVYRANILVRAENPTTEDLANANRRNFELTQSIADKLQKQIETLREYDRKLEDKIQKPLHVESGHVFRSQYNNETPWPWINHRYRSSVNIQFDQPYEKPPRVVLGLIEIDHGHSTPARVGVTVINVTKSGFEAQCYTWLDSVTYSISFSWISYGN